MKHRKTFLHQLTRSFVTISEFITLYNYCVPPAINMCCLKCLLLRLKNCHCTLHPGNTIKSIFRFFFNIVKPMKKSWENTKQLSVQEQRFYQASQSLLGEVVLASLFFFDIEMWTFKEFSSVRRMTVTKFGREHCFHISTLKRLS